MARSAAAESVFTAIACPTRVTAYDILRHNGIDIGKRDYLTHVGRYIRKRD
jgi:hypothetical protein